MPVDPVGVQDDGDMQIPEDANRAGWYRFGPAPADAQGATVLAAHVDSRLTGVGQFSRLRKLGARIDPHTHHVGRPGARLPGRRSAGGSEGWARPSPSGSTGRALHDWSW